MFKEKLHQSCLRIILLFCTIIFPVVCFAYQSNSNENFLDKKIRLIMLKHNIPAASIAVINRNHLAFVRTYKNPNYPKLKIKSNAMFQAASASKVVTALASLRLVSEGKLNLDEDINNKLRSWKIPVNHFARNKKVTVHNILNMTSGLSAHRFVGYPTNTKLPSLQQILEGQPPANSEPVLVRFIPGTKYFYSSGGFLVLQQLIQDVMHTKFSIAMEELIFRPLDMQHSLYAAKVHKLFTGNIVPGFVNGAKVSGGWYNYPELASNGLWATSKDLAKVVINIMQSYQGKSSGLLSQNIAKQMLTKQKNTPYGLGFIVEGQGKNLSFTKSGQNFGYVSMIAGLPNTGKGAVVMINSNNNLAGVRAIMRAIEKKYQWPQVKPSTEKEPQDKETKFVLSVLGKVGLNNQQLTPEQKKFIKKIQKAAKKNPYSERTKQEAKVEQNPFANVFFHPNYILPFYYTQSPADNIYGNTIPEQQTLRNLEFKAQFSFKVPLWRKILQSKISLYAAYTQLIYWQLYASSAYFRESDYQPELFVDYPLFNWNTWRLGAVHQSNGRGGNMERTWNRIYIESIFSFNNWMMLIKS